jgi:hypothetical protein
MSEEREVLLVGGPRDGQPVRYRVDLLRYGFDVEAAVNASRTVEHGGRYVKRRYEHPLGSVLELFVWFAEGENYE